MHVVYALEPYPTEVTKTIFLAGPTPRKDAASWRKDALRLLEEKGFDGHVFVPEPKGGRWAEEYEDQIAWEEEFLRGADCILFWIPRDLEGTKPDGNQAPMAGLTTNDEWGAWKTSGKVVLGAPAWADSTRYQQHYAEELQVPFAATLAGTVDKAIELVGEGAQRYGNVATKIPHFIWTRPDFQAWYSSQSLAGNITTQVDVVWTCWVGPKRDRLFLYALHPVVHLPAEARNKANECVVVRPDISVVALYEKNPEVPSNSKVVLIREFRTPVRNEAGYVYELPGGSSSDKTKDPASVAADEIHEELDFELEPSRLRHHGSRQMGATLASYHAHLFSAELTREEMAAFEADTDIHGENDEERITVSVQTLGEILSKHNVDWPMLGMLFEVFAA